MALVILLIVVRVWIKVHVETKVALSEYEHGISVSNAWFLMVIYMKWYPRKTTSPETEGIIEITD